MWCYDVGNIAFYHVVFLAVPLPVALVQQDSPAPEA